PFARLCRASGVDTTVRTPDTLPDSRGPAGDNERSNVTGGWRQLRQREAVRGSTAPAYLEQSKLMIPSPARGSGHFIIPSPARGGRQGGGVQREADAERVERMVEAGADHLDEGFLGSPPPQKRGVPI